MTVDSSIERTDRYGSYRPSVDTYVYVYVDVDVHINWAHTYLIVV